MAGILDRQFERLSKVIKRRASLSYTRFVNYLKRLFLPVYLFPIKLITYTIYYLFKFLIKFIFAFASLIFEAFIFPFRSLKNFLKSIFFLAIFLYLFASLLVIADYLDNQYGYWKNLLCSIGVREKLQDSVVRVVGGYSEGTGFFIAEDQVLTNFHVIDDEPSPKIILPNGSFTTTTKVIGNKEADLAVLFTENKYPNMVLALPDKVSLLENEPLISAGYPLGTDLTGKATILKGNFVEFRRSRKDPVSYIQTDISLVKGMSGGPLTDMCGQVVGINTLSLAGLSLFIIADQAKSLMPSFTDQEIVKIKVDPSLSPEEAVRAFYTYLKARRMEEGFALLSKEYLKKTNFEEWTNRFKDILDVEIVKVERFNNLKDTVFVKFTTKNWVDGETERRFYEGTWKTVKEDGVYKMLKSNIKEIANPSWDWFF